MDVEGMTESVENVISSVHDTQVGDDQVRSETDAYNIDNATIMETTVVKAADTKNKVCNTPFSLNSFLLLGHRSAV